MPNSSKLILTGGGGLVGRHLLQHLSQHVVCLAPSHEELDITNGSAVERYVTTHAPNVIIHAAAFTDNDAAEKERGNTKGKCYQVNVKGTKNIMASAKNHGVYVVYISTGSVFAGDKNHSGPFTESDTPAKEEKLSWYAWTKLMAEREVHDGTVLRLSHPVGEEQIFDVSIESVHEQMPIRRDYVHTLVHLFDTDALYPLFPDQYFTLSFMDDLVIAIKELMAKQHKGIFHIASFDQTNPYDLASYAIYRARHVEPQLKTLAFEKFIKTTPHPLRYAQYLGIDGKQTQKILHLAARTWKEIIDCVYPLPAVY